MSKNKTFFLINNESNSQDAFLVRNEFHKALAEKRIIKEILLDEDYLVIEEDNQDAKLKKVK